MIMVHFIHCLPLGSIFLCFVNQHIAPKPARPASANGSSSSSPRIGRRLLLEMAAKKKVRGPRASATSMDIDDSSSDDFLLTSRSSEMQEKNDWDNLKVRGRSQDLGFSVQGWDVTFVTFLIKILPYYLFLFYFFSSIVFLISFRDQKLIGTISRQKPLFQIMRRRKMLTTMRTRKRQCIFQTQSIFLSWTTKSWVLTGPVWTQQSNYKKTIKCTCTSGRENKSNLNVFLKL